MFTATFIFLLTLAFFFDAGSYTSDNAQSAAFDKKEHYEMLLDRHEYLLNSCIRFIVTPQYYRS